MESFDSDERRGASVGDAGEHRREALITHGPVLRVHKEPIVTAVGKLLRNGRAVGIQEKSKLRLTCPQLILEIDSFDCSAHCLLRCWRAPHAAKAGWYFT